MDHDHIITWNFSNDDTAEMPAPKMMIAFIITLGEIM